MTALYVSSNLQSKLVKLHTTKYICFILCITRIVPSIQSPLSDGLLVHFRRMYWVHKGAKDLCHDEMERPKFLQTAPQVHTLYICTEKGKPTPPIYKVINACKKTCESHPVTMKYQRKLNKKWHFIYHLSNKHEAKYCLERWYRNLEIESGEKKFRVRYFKNVGSSLI